MEHTLFNKPKRLVQHTRQKETHIVLKREKNPEANTSAKNESSLDTMLCQLQQTQAEDFIDNSDDNSG